MHRTAYNQAFDYYKIDANWSPEYYDELQNLVGGGIPKMRHYFTNVASWPSSTLSSEPPSDVAAQDAFLETVQATKTQMYKDLVSGGVAKLRPGIRRVIEEAAALPDAERPALAVCSASTKSACYFVLDNLLGKDDLLPKFDLVLAGDDVENRKPHPEIYEVAATTLGMSKEKCVVVEDSLVGLQAAMGAGMKCMITTTSSTRDQDFSGAAAVVDDFDAGSVTVATLRGILGGGGGAAATPATPKAAPAVSTATPSEMQAISELIDVSEDL